MPLKMTFGFRNVNGAAFDIKLLQTPTGRFPSERTVFNIRHHVVKTINVAGKRAWYLTQIDGWSPKLTGALVNSIRWLEASKSEVYSSRVISGALTVNVPYGRRQEFEHTTRGRYLARALEAVHPEFLDDLKNRNVLEDVFFSRGQYSEKF